MQPRAIARVLATLVAAVAFAAAAVRVPVSSANAQALLDAGISRDSAGNDAVANDAVANDAVANDAAAGIAMATDAAAREPRGDASVANTVGVGAAGDVLSTPADESDDVFGPPRAIVPGLGRLRVVANRPDSRVLLDGREVGFAPCEVDVRPGTYRLRVDSPFQRPWEGSATIRPERLHAFRVFLRPAPNRTGAAVILTLTTLVFGGGITLGVLAQVDRGALDASRDAGRLDNNDPRISRGAAFAWVADLSFVFGGVLGALGGYFAFADLGAPSIGRMSRRQRLEVSR